MTTFSEGALNLTTHRAAGNVWDRRGWNGNPEWHGVVRALAGIGGGALVVQGMRQKSPFGRVLAGVGATLAWWAVIGPHRVSAAKLHVAEMRQRAFGGIRDAVQTASDDSFPASDAPSWTPTLGAGTATRR